VSGRKDFLTALEAIMAKKREELGEPPAPEELLAYRDGRLDSEARELLESKIAVYPDAARALADLAAFPNVEPGPDTPELSDEEIGARWQTFRGRLAELPPPSRTEEPETRPRSARWPTSWSLAAAAVLLLSIGLSAGYLAGRSGNSPGRKISPSLNVTIAELMPLEDQEGGVRASAAPVQLEPRSDELLLILILPETKNFSGYAAQIFDRQGASLWSGDGLLPTTEGTFRLSFARDAFTPGVYRIDLFGVDDTGKKRLARYELWVS